MATGYSSVPSQLSHGGCDDDGRRLTYSPPGSRTLRERDHDSPQHAVHDTCDGVQSDSRAALSRQCGANIFGGEADVETEGGLAAVSWRAGVTILDTRQQCEVDAACAPSMTATSSSFM